MSSGIFHGVVHHSRLGDKPHHFNYSMYMLGLDLDELANTLSCSKLLSTRWFSPIRFKAQDYVPGSQNSLKQRVLDKLALLGNKQSIKKVIAVVQGRCFGVYFSPINFYIGLDEHDKPLVMLAEVSNTPWLERHYYKVDLAQTLPTPKAFHVSPFMNMDMDYHWRVKYNGKKLLVHIENHTNANKLFSATMALKCHEISKINLMKTLFSLPAMTVKIFAAIYWQALKLFMKRVPFVAHPER